MPGVPSNRGCDACRKQKKKCNTKEHPCARCKRLGINCVGLGQQRYKFQNVAVPKQDRIVVSDIKNPVAGKDAMMLQPASCLSSPTTRLTSALVDKINPLLDMRYQLVWTFGAFLVEIPRHLGVNSALDTAVDTLVAAYAGFCLGNFEPDASVRRKYSRALCTLRITLDDPVQAQSSETLCSAMLLMFCQAFINPGNGALGLHTEGAAQMLKSRGYCGPRNEFENTLLLTLRGPVVFEALLNDRIRFTRKEWDDLVANRAGGSDLDGKIIVYVSRLPDLIERGREALYGKVSPTSDLENMREETRRLREECRLLMSDHDHRLMMFDEQQRAGKPIPANIRGHLWVHYQRTKALALTLGIMVNCVLSALDPHDISLRKESSQLADRILGIAHSQKPYRPLGALVMILCLSLAWVGADDEDSANNAEALLLDYESACLGPKAAHTLGDLQRIKRRFTLEGAYISTANIEDCDV